MPPSRRRRYPDFLCIGAQKAATTWLYQRLAEHPDIWLPPQKEIHYFDVLHRQRKPGEPMVPMDRGIIEKALGKIRRIAKSNNPPDINQVNEIYLLSLIGLRTLTDDWYGRIFAMAPKKAICGEITPEYALLGESGIRHILRLNPEVRILFVVRDPIDRAWSSMRMKERRGESKSFSTLVRSKTFLAMSDYAATVERFRRRIATSKFLVMHFDDVITQPQGFLHRVCDFLGVDGRRAQFSNIEEPVHQGQEAELDSGLYDKLRSALEPVYERLLSLDDPVMRDWHERHYARVGNRRSNTPMGEAASQA